MVPQPWTMTTIDAESVRTLLNLLCSGDKETGPSVGFTLRMKTPFCVENHLLTKQCMVSYVMNKQAVAKAQNPKEAPS
jgi:hypothetical protein